MAALCVATDSFLTEGAALIRWVKVIFCILLAAAAPFVGGITAQADVAISVVTASTYVQSGYVYVVGEIRNQGSSSFEFARVNINYYDSSNNLIATDYTYAWEQVVDPGNRSPFEDVMSEPAGFDHVALAGVSAEPASQASNRNFTTSISNTFTDSGGYQHLVGTVTNDNTSTDSFVKVLFTFYDGSGTVVDTDYTYISSDSNSDLASRQSASFELFRVPRPYAQVTAFATSADPGSPLPNSPPIGSWEGLRLAVGGFAVGGWALDADTTAAVGVHVYVDGGFFAAMTAAGDRPDVAQAYPAYGPNHGFNGAWALGPGMHTICLYAINTPAGPNPSLGCHQWNQPANPFGNLDADARGYNGLSVSGWGIDPDTASSIAVHVYVDGSFAGGTSASDSRGDLAGMYPAFGSSHGFHLTVPIAPGRHTVCAYGINVGGGANASLGCRSVAAGTPVGSFDGVARRPGGLLASGWTLDPDTTSSINAHVYVDGQFGQGGQAAASRPDVASAFPGYGGAHGVGLMVPMTDTQHSVCMYGLDADGEPNSVLGCRTVNLSGTPYGSLDSAGRSGNNLTLAGWAIDPDTSSSIAVHVYVDGHLVQVLGASGARSDVASAYPGYGSAHGFSTAVAVSSGGHQVCVYAINDSGVNPQLACRSV
jgi:hypothetical protein